MTGYDIFSYIMLIAFSALILYTAIRMNRKKSFEKD